MIIIMLFNKKMLLKKRESLIIEMEIAQKVVQI